MKTKNKETYSKLLEEAARAFNERFKGLKELKLVPRIQKSRIGVQGNEALVNLISGKNTISYQAEIRPRISHALRHLLVMQKAAAERPFLLVTGYMNPMMAEHFIEDGLEFIDGAGNAFINLGFMKVISKGNLLKTGTPPVSPRLFKGAGLKVVFALLSQPGLVSGTFRDIASRSGVALGTAAGIIDELKSRLFLVEDSGGARRLIRKKELFEGWVTAYPEQLRPKIHLGRYRGESGWWHETKLDPGWAQWGGEVAASRLTGHLYPQVVSIYLSTARLNDFLLMNRLSLDKDGHVEILERFWPEGLRTSAQELVHPLLIYADLMASGIDRNVEAAKGIYDRHFARYLRED